MTMASGIDHGQSTLELLLDSPAAQPPPGMTPNFGDPSPVRRIFIATLSICITVPTLAVIIRIYTKKNIMKQSSLEDYVVILGWAASVAAYAVLVVVYNGGGGTHQWNIRFRELPHLLYWANLDLIIYCCVIALVKVSILLQYSRIFVPCRKTNKSLSITIQVLIWCIVLFYSTMALLAINECIPRKKIWSPLMASGHCVDKFAAYEATGIFSILTDFALLIVPMAPLWRLQLPLSKRLRIMGVFACGFFACVASILRTYYIWLITKSSDVTYSFMTASLWSAAEIALGLLVSCAPVMPIAFRQFMTQSHRFYSSWSTALGQKIKRNRLGSSLLSSSETKIRDATIESRPRLKNEHFAGMSIDIMPTALNSNGRISKYLDLENGLDHSLRH